MSKDFKATSTRNSNKLSVEVSHTGNDRAYIGIDDGLKILGMHLSPEDTQGLIVFLQKQFPKRAEPTIELKVGDRVRDSDGGYSFSRNNPTGVVTNIYGPCITVRLDRDQRLWNYFRSELELLKVEERPKGVEELCEVVPPVFNVGDTIRAVHAKGYENILTVGKEYVVARANRAAAESCVGIEKSDNGGYVSAFASRFELVKKYVEPEPEIKLGDWVICVDTDRYFGGNLVKGHIYEVKTLNDREINGWFSYRFKPYKRPWTDTEYEQAHAMNASLDYYRRRALEVIS